MIKILKKILVALIISVLAFPHASIVMAAKPTPPSSSFTLIDSLLKAKKPSSEPKLTTWNGNGTTDGLCNDLSYDESVTAGKQSWLFILTSPAAVDDYSLTTKFDGDNIGTEVTGDRKGNGSVHFTVETNIGAQLDSASAELGTSNSVLTVSHCTHSVKPLEVEKTANTSYTRTWDWDIEKVGKDGESEISDLGEMEGDETQTVNYEITLSADSEDHDYLVIGDITIYNPAGNPQATIDSIIDELDESGIVDVTCPDEFDMVLDEDEEVTCTYSQEVDNDLDTENTVTVDATIGGLVLQTVATAEVDWEVEPTEIDDCVTLSDTNSLFGEKYNVDEEVKVCATDLEEGSMTFTYDVIFGEDVELVCGLNNYPNTARVLSLRLDEEDEPIMLDEDQWTVTYTYNCPIASCSYSQGYWFSKPGVEWLGSITIGGQDYSQLDGLLVWNSGNQGGVTHAKKAFLQLATVLLSFYPDSLPSPLDGYQDTIDAFLDGKIVTGNNITESDAAVNSAADAISSWIGENHCTDDDFVDQ